MRRAMTVLLCLAAPLACSEPDTRIEAAQVTWMEWPAEVAAATPFPARLVGYGVACVEVVRFEIAPTLDQSAVTFEPYFLIRGQPQFCRELAAFNLVAAFFDTSTGVPGLASEFPRTYEMRAGTDVYARSFANALPVKTFGEISVGIGGTGRTNAGGFANAARDSVGCLRLMPYGLHPGYIVENPPPPDTAQYWTAFVRGYIYEPAAPVCGETRVFHLVTRG